MAPSALTDYLKCAHPLGWAVANLAFSVMEFKDAYKSSGNYDVAVRAIKWGTDWLLKGHVSASDDPSQNAFVGQVCVCVCVCSDGKQPC